MGGLLSKNIHHFNKGKNSVFIATKSTSQPLHIFRHQVEMKRIKIKDFNLETSAFLEKTAGSSDGKGVKTIKPTENKIILENGREIKYN